MTRRAAAHDYTRPGLYHITMHVAEVLGQPLFEGGYCDVMPVDAQQLATQRAYIAGNPRSRLLRSSRRAQLTVQQSGIDTALTPLPAEGQLVERRKERNIT